MVLRVLTNLSRVSVWVAGALVLLTAFMICADVVARNLFGSNVVGTFDITGYMLAISTAWSFSFTLLQRANIRVDIVHAKLPQNFRAVLDVLAALSLALLAILLTYHAYGVFVGSFDRHSLVPFSSSVRLWYFQLAWVLGLAFFSIVASLVSLMGIRALLSGDFGRAHALIGPKTVEEEVEEALHATDHPSSLTAD